MLVSKEQGGEHGPGAIDIAQNTRNSSVERGIEIINRAIARACKVSNSTVGEYLRRAEEAGIGLAACRRG